MALLVVPPLPVVVLFHHQWENSGLVVSTMVTGKTGLAPGGIVWSVWGLCLVGLTAGEMAAAVGLAQGEALPEGRLLGK